MSLIARIEALLEPILNAYGYAIVRVNLSGDPRPILQVMIEHINETPILAGDCAHMSRVISTHLDVADPISGPYVLEVSSAGIERPLVKPKDFQRFCGKEISLVLATPLKGKKRFIGKLVDANEEEIVLRFKAGDGNTFLEEKFKIKDIKTAKIHVDFAKV